MSLCKLVRYLADHALKHPGIALKEYQIATEIFGRPADFDPHLDSLVRVQAGRLRSKLSEYYASEGAEDPIVVELPKGTYTLGFHNAASSTKTILHSAQEVEPPPGTTHTRKGSLLTIGLGSLLAIAIFIIVGLLLTRNQKATGSASAGAPAAAAFRVFWQRFTAGPEEPWVIFSNGAFVGNALGQLHHEIRVKRGSLFSLDDAQNNNLIFVGSPAENLTLLDIPSTHEFVFQRLTTGPRKGDLAVINVHPQPDEPKMFLASPSGTPLTEDYAIVGLVPGMNPARSVLILAGTTTIGTQAAAEYVCRQDSLEQLLLRLSVSENGEMKPFEAVLHVKVARGVPVGSELVALRRVAQ